MQNLENLPFGSTYNPPEKILCAANKYGDIIVCGVRHADMVMMNCVDVIAIHDELIDNEIQGFMTTKHRFLNRQEAWKLAVEQNQIVRRVGNDTKLGGTLYSENLY